MLLLLFLDHVPLVFVEVKHMFLPKKLTTLMRNDDVPEFCLASWALSLLFYISTSMSANNN